MVVKAAVLGARGMIGQRFISMLASNPMFEITSITSKSHIGERYGENLNWVINDKPPSKILNYELEPSDPKVIKADIVFSALPSEEYKVEEEFVREGFMVVSNSSAHRLDPDIPLLVPEVNPEHLKLLKMQGKRRGWRGKLVKSANCTTTIASLPLKIIHDNFGLEKVVITSMQAISGAGYPGVPAYDINGNIIPYIRGEEEKVNRELTKILSKFDGEKLVNHGIEIYASCNRVPVLDGHLISIYIETSTDTNVETVKEMMANFKGLPQELKLPTAPEKPIIVYDGTRPQPRIDVYAGSVPGMSVTVGRIRKLDRKRFMFHVLGHNTIRGGAGSAILIAELIISKNICGDKIG